MSNQKTPTTILLTPERKFHSFGYAARDFYHDLDPNEAKQWLYLEKFKMKLHTTGVSQPFLPWAQVLQPWQGRGLPNPGNPRVSPKQKLTSICCNFRNDLEHTTLWWNSQHTLIHTWAERYSEYLILCLPWKLLRVDTGWSAGRGGWGLPATPGAPSSVAGLLGDLGILRAGLRGQGHLGDPGQWLLKISLEVNLL